MSEIFMKQVIDALTGESVVVPFTDEETAEHLDMQLKTLAAEETRKSDEIAQALSRKTAIAKLAKLGLTQAEIESL